VFVRWSGQSIEAETAGQLPGYADTVIRTFKAPDSLDVRFHEVRAKSALNRVPTQSRVPFEWTVNPYRGCLHSCTYCTSGDTRILLGDGRTRPMAELRVGDEIYGTEVRGRYRHYVKTQVLDHWSVIKPAYRTTLADGTELITSGDHRFLTERGWKHVSGEMRDEMLLGPGRNPVDDDSTVIATDAARVTGVESLGREETLYDITTGTGDFISNGVVSHNCFARPTHEYLEFDAGRDFEREIVVKVNLPEVLRAELAKPSWKGDHVALGTNTDPYQWVEKRYRLMRGIWEAFRDASNPCSVLTKSPLLLRDADLMLEIAARAKFSACLSIPTMDEKAWRASEPHTPHPKARLEAVKELNRLGIPTGVLVAPLMPGINDSPAQVEKVLDACRDAGAVSIGGQALFLAGSTKDVFMEWLRGYRPDLVPEYERLYEGRSRLKPADREKVEAPLKRGRRSRAGASPRGPALPRAHEIVRGPRAEDWPIRPETDAAAEPVPLTPQQRAAALSGQEALF
jgi:DNA repair photolyase